MNVNSVQVIGKEEGDRLIAHLTDMEIWVTPFVIEKDGHFFVKAAIPLKRLFSALSFIRNKEYEINY